MSAGANANTKQDRKKFKLLNLVLVFLIVLALLLTALAFIPSGRPGQSILASWFSSNTPVFTVNEFHFDVGRNRDFAHSNGSIAAVGSLGLQVLGSDGRETLRDTFRAEQPAIVESNGRFSVFDIGGNTIRVFQASQIISSFETDGVIVSVSINNNGWFCVVTQEVGGFLGTVTVYNADGEPVYLVNMGTGYVVSAHLSPDNETLAILSLSDTGSRITYYYGIDTHKDDPDLVFTLPESVIFAIEFLSNTKILAVSTDSLLTIDSDGSPNHIYLYNDRRLGGYAVSDSFIALHLYDYGIGFSGRLITLDYDGEILGEITTNREIMFMSAFGSSLVLLLSDNIVFFNETLEASPLVGEGYAAASHLLALTEDVVLAAGDNFATILRREDLD
ncbi:MAG: DUF5711 family protein [Oscillospiraceae bacterium]|nr:DUF5711 family protein [Oscillospiraceae bacterium]